MPVALNGRGTEARPLRIYAFGVSRNRLEQVIHQLRVPAVIVRDTRDADMVMTVKSYFRQKAQPLREAEARGMSVYVLRSNTTTQIEQLLASIFSVRPASDAGDRTNANETRSCRTERPPRAPGGDPLMAAISEAEDAIVSVMGGGPPVQLEPQVSRIRQVQHQLAERYAVASRSRGREPHRRVEISRDGSW